MKNKLIHALAATAVAATMLSAPAISSAAGTADAKVIAEGKKLAFKRSKGNCLACHMIKGGSLPGNIGPALIAMKLRYPDKQKLHDKIWGKPEQEIKYSMMPPFGRHVILSDDEINKIVEYIYTL
ncbi:monoheme cytochrome SoxX (sulfur oxidation) [Sulfurivirga caldicuralii]|uniref:Monoheme cytochrome SoxX (Sulfur oxidation) n=1 Tax=Sulfurivirga caldicuralii TaxID=364032 RepID=A0A1N6DXC4_9GAMM|nr:sulfur oxidation c-type cytochrome SoxX [Sulfurivirga caldicuralii]SIN75367.1 monoheme cytochrome SoxX (sulfur oxidation) [Sulfurivirga caldicuralii]